MDGKGMNSDASPDVIKVATIMMRNCHKGCIFFYTMYWTTLLLHLHATVELALGVEVQSFYSINAHPQGVY
jgi:hypothetical protein